MKLTNKYLILAASIAMLGGFASNAKAQIAWSANATTGDMNTGSNWALGSPPATTESMAFGYSPITTLNNNLGSATTLGVLFNQGASAYTIGGTTGLSFAAGTFITNNSSNLQTFTTAITPTGNALTITTNGYGGDVLISGNITGTGSGRLTKSGLGTLTLSGDGAIAGGGSATINAGTLVLDFSTRATASNMFTSTALTFGAISSSGLVIKGKSGAVTSQSFNGLTVGAGMTNKITIDNNNATSTTLTLQLSGTGNFTRGSTGTLNIDLGTSGLASVTTNGVITGGTGVPINGILGYATVKDSTGKTGFATQDGSFNLVRYTYTPGQVLTGGADANVTTENYTVNAASVTLSANPHTTNSLSIDTSSNGVVLDLGGANLSATAGAILMDGAHNLTIQNGTLGTPATALMIHQMGTGNMTFAGTFNTSTGVVVKDGDGKLVLTGTTGANTGKYELRAGILSISSAANLGGSTAGITFNGGTLESTGANVTLNSSRAISFMAGRGTFLVDGSNVLSLGYGMTGTAAAGSDKGFNKTGTGTLTITSGTNAYTGSTFVSAGTLLLSGSGAINTSSEIIVANGATFTNNTLVAVSTILNLSKGATVNGSGSFNPSAMKINADLTGGPVSPFITNTVNLSANNGSLSLTLSNITAGSYTLYSAAVGGIYSGVMVNGSALSNGGSGIIWSGSNAGYNYTFEDSDFRALNITAAVPEPSTWAMLVGAGVFFLFAVRRRRMASK